MRGGGWWNVCYKLGILYIESTLPASSGLNQIISVSNDRWNLFSLTCWLELQLKNTNKPTLIYGFVLKFFLPLYPLPISVVKNPPLSHSSLYLQVWKPFLLSFIPVINPLSIHIPTFITLSYKQGISLIHHPKYRKYHSPPPPIKIESHSCKTRVRNSRWTPCPVICPVPNYLKLSCEVSVLWNCKTVWTMDGRQLYKQKTYVCSFTIQYKHKYNIRLNYCNNYNK